MNFPRHTPVSHAIERKATISGVVVARNEEPLIERCLDSLLAVTDEVVLVHDGPCADRTVEKAIDLGCRVFVRPQVGDPEHHTVFAYQQARCEWLLNIDADEFLSPELISVIPSLVDQSEYSGWKFRWPMWDGERYISERGPYKLALFRRKHTSLIGRLQAGEHVMGRVGRRPETLHHQPSYNNFTWRSVRTKWRRWTRVHASELVSPFAELPKFNYTGPQEWPLSRHISNVLSPVLAIPNGIAHFLLAVVRGALSREDVSLRVSFYLGVYATMLQLDVARIVYWERPLRRLGRGFSRRSGAR